MVNEFSTEASVVALYGLHLSPGWAEPCYKRLVEWFDSLGCHPDRGGVSGKGFSEKMGTFDRFDKKLHQKGFQGVRGFSLFRLIPGGEIPGYHWCANAEVDEEESYCIVGSRSSIAPVPGESMFSIARSLIRDLSPIYGIGFRREMDLGPTFYAMGGCMGLQPWGPEKSEGERIDRWRALGIKQRVYEEGFLRGVYRWNVLTELQLARQIEGVSLRRWIEEDRERGSLAIVEGSTWLWEVKEEQMPRVRSAMENAGMVFDVGPTGGSGVSS